MTWTRGLSITFAVGGVLAVLLAFALFYGWPGNHNKSILEPENAQVVAAGQQIYFEYCADCHGQNLEGAPDWQTFNSDGTLPAPPHDETGHTWHHTSQLLFELTKYGTVGALGGNGQPTNMPAFENVLQDDQILAVLSFIKSTWPEEIQDRHDQLDAALSQGG